MLLVEIWDSARDSPNCRSASSSRFHHKAPGAAGLASIMHAHRAQASRASECPLRPARRVSECACRSISSGVLRQLPAYSYQLSVSAKYFECEHRWLDLPLKSCELLAAFRTTPLPALSPASPTRSRHSFHAARIASIFRGSLPIEIIDDQQLRSQPLRCGRSCLPLP